MEFVVRFKSGRTHCRGGPGVRPGGQYLVVYDHFLDQYPDSPHAEEAETRIRALEEAKELALLEKAKISHLLSDTCDYLKKYPQGR